MQLDPDTPGCVGYGRKIIERPYEFPGEGRSRSWRRLRQPEAGAATPTSS